MSDGTFADNQTTQQWRFPEFLVQLGSLTAAGAMDYFALSPFWDNRSNNQTLRMQTMYSGVPLVNEAEQLKQFIGIEFAIVHAQPPGLFVIHKRKRTSQHEAQPIAAYYVLHGNVYQAPDLYAVLSSRLLGAGARLKDSYDRVHSNQPAYDPWVQSTYPWRIVKAERGAERTAETSPSGPARDAQIEAESV
ncbi:hypothetical protein E5Q_03363 [Mixia osmundae IAM 14324]|uniref:Mediator of RNA polymerase II transcription subunit 6 n=1 Tax=Mixia osmundae (strain CBS 9802 / IAM 14324 / JCM 22182 / KY 12970) TaxID=764103 RepID=G7E1I2_MIXOS|nr:hypothetical protein E5Q_03363 [Mixia osmundae IAM 14324]